MWRGLTAKPHCFTGFTTPQAAGPGLCFSFPEHKNPLTSKFLTLSQNVLNPNISQAVTGKLHFFATPLPPPHPVIQARKILALGKEAFGHF